MPQTTHLPPAAVAQEVAASAHAVQDADSTDVYTISRKWADLVKRARAKQLQPHEFNSLTFTISNLGMFGAEQFDAILPPGACPVHMLRGSVACADFPQHVAD